MIPFNFKYMVPDNAREAVQAWKEAEGQGENPLYYSGGTEIITLCREQKINPGTVIDIKKIPDCNIFSENGISTYGSALSLNEIAEKTSLQIVTKALTAIADHTIRNKLTLGGNIMGRLPYREGVLPFLILDGSATIASPEGTRTENFPEIFDKRMLLAKGELLLNVNIRALRKGEKWFFIRKEKAGRVDYPVLTACFAGSPGDIRMSISGAFSYPLRNRDAEIIINDSSQTVSKRSLEAASLLDSLFKSDFRASGQYRKHLLKLAITDALTYMENDDENLQ